ncbi:MAG TPA: hypothetical protein VFU45_05020 [Gemmatimonadales bacterium]|nr:hypothetical protein [Gemmatimonadales bacterium]
MRHSRFPPRLMRAAASSALACAALACGPRGGRVSARVSGAAFQTRLAGPAQASVCRSRGVLVLEGSEGDDGLAMVWFFGDSLKADSVPVGPPIWRRPSSTDSLRSTASGAYRRTTDIDVMGYQTRNGWLRVTPGQDGTVAAAFAAVFDRTGAAESLWVTGRFDGVRPQDDSTLCRIPRAAPDSGVTLGQ